MNDFEIATIIVGSLASISGCLAALAALITIREMRAQRVYSYRPNIFVAGLRFGAFRDESVGIEYSFTWLAHPKLTETQHPESGVLQSVLTIKVYNLGFGAAQQLSIKWNFDIIRIIKDANYFAQKAGIPMYYDFDGKVIKKNLRGKLLAVYYWDNEYTESIDFIVPVSMIGSGVDVSVPIAIVDLLSNYIVLAFEVETGNSSDIKIDTSFIELSFHYQDMDGAQHSSAFRLSCDVHIFSPHASSGNPIFEGAISSRRLDSLSGKKVSENIRL